MIRIQLELELELGRRGFPEGMRYYIYSTSSFKHYCILRDPRNKIWANATVTVIIVDSDDINDASQRSAKTNCTSTKLL